MTSKGSLLRLKLDTQSERARHEEKQIEGLWRFALCNSEAAFSDAKPVPEDLGDQEALKGDILKGDI